MAAILGLRDTETYAADRFQNWRRTILYSFPNGSAPLTALLSLTKPESTNDPRFNWYEKPLPTQRAALTAAYLIGATTILVSVSVFRVGHIILNELTNEQMKVTGVSADGLTLTVLRGKWTTAAAASVGAADPIVVVTNSNPEGGDVPQLLSYDPDPKFNLTGIFRTPFGGTGTSLKTSLKYDKSGPYVERMREGLNLQSIEMEKGFLFGEQAQYTDPATGETERNTGGVISFLNASNIKTVAGGTLSPAIWSGYLEQVFRLVLNNSREKLALCGSNALSVMNQLAIGGSVINNVPESDSFGMEFRVYHTPFGRVYFKDHPLFTQHPTWRNYILILDIKGLRYRYLTGRDTAKLTNRQSNGSDKRVDEFLSECGLEVHHVDAHMLIKNVLTYIP